MERLQLRSQDKKELGSFTDSVPDDWIITFEEFIQSYNFSSICVSVASTKGYERSSKVIDFK